MSMSPVSPDTVTRKPARTGIGWLIQHLAAPSHQSVAPNTDLLFPASAPRPTAETFITSWLIGSWSLAACLLLCLEWHSLPASAALRCLVGGLIWLIALHLTVILPIAAFPLLRLCRLRVDHLARMVEITFLLLLTFIAAHLTVSESTLAHLLGLSWIVLIMAEIALRLVRAGIALASRSA
jgi:hypothetical protein